MSYAQAFTLPRTESVKVTVSFQPYSPCWCPSTPLKCDAPAAGTRSFVLRRSDGYGISVPWQQGDSTVANVPAGTYTIELNEGSVPPGSYAVTYAL
jgi:hypothetical protein